MLLTLWMLLVCLMHLLKLSCREMACYPSSVVSLLLFSSVVLVQDVVVPKSSSMM